MARAGDGDGIGADELLAAMASLGHEAGAFEHRHVLLHGGEAHGVAVGQARDRQLAVGRAAQQIASRHVGQGVQHVVDLGFGELIYNH